MNNDTNKLIPDLRFPEFVNKEEWMVKKLEDVADIVTGNTPSTVEPANYNGNNMFVSPYDINDSRYISQTKTTLSDLGFSKTRQIQANSVLFVCIGSTIGKIAQSKFKCATNQQINSLIPKEGNSSDFLYSILDFNSKKIASIAGNHAVPIINKTSFSGIELSFPPNINEQQKIASCLFSLDEVIAAHNQKLEALKEHKKGLMQNLFPQEGETVPKKRFREFLGDGDWVEKSIQKLIDENQIISHLDGNHGALYPKAEEFSKEGIPYISANDFITGIIDFSKCKYLPLSKANKFKKGVAKDGDILFAHNATVGPVAKLNTDFPFVILSTTATYFRCDNKNLINDFLRFALTSPLFVRQYTRVMSQSTRNQIPITAQREFILQIPKPKEQQKIAECLSSLDNSITVQAEKVEQLKLHKRGLMQGLFPKVIEE